MGAPPLQLATLYTGVQERPAARMQTTQCTRDEYEDSNENIVEIKCCSSEASH